MLVLLLTVAVAVTAGVNGLIGLPVGILTLARVVGGRVAVAVDSKVGRLLQGGLITVSARHYVLLGAKEVADVERCQGYLCERGSRCFYICLFSY